MRSMALIFVGMTLPSLLPGAERVEKLSMKPTATIQRADLIFVETVKRPEAVLVLCPGYNGNGEGLVRKREWQEYAKSLNLGLVGLSFASDGEMLRGGNGYYYPAKGSGQLLLDGLKRHYGRDLPVLLYGFSGGAHFTSRFAEWKPGRVLGWCSYSAAWWDDPVPLDRAPPGLVVCGDQDASRYGASLLFLKQGRAAGRPWLWLSLPETGHHASAKLDAFVRDYFRAILSDSSGGWVDVDREEIISTVQANNQPSLSGWLPCKTLFEGWRALHAP